MKGYKIKQGRNKNLQSARLWQEPPQKNEARVLSVVPPYSVSLCKQCRVSANSLRSRRWIFSLFRNPFWKKWRIFIKIYRLGFYFKFLQNIQIKQLSLLKMKWFSSEKLCLILHRLLNVITDPFIKHTSGMLINIKYFVWLLIGSCCCVNNNKDKERCPLSLQRQNISLLPHALDLPKTTWITTVKINRFLWKITVINFP